MKQTLIGYVIGRDFCNTEALIDKHGCICGYDEKHKLFKTEKAAQAFIEKHDLDRDNHYIRGYYSITLSHTVDAGKVAYALAGLK